MIRLSDLTWSVPTIATYLGRHEQTVRKYIKAFLRDGFAALPDRPRSGRPRRLTEEQLLAVERLLDEAAGRGETWTMPQLVGWLQAHHGVRVHPEYLRRRLRPRRFRWKRTKRTVRHKADPLLQTQAQAHLEVVSF